MGKTTEASRCPLCKSEGAQPALEKYVDSGTTYTLHHCAACTGEYWLPLKNPGAEWYENDSRYHSGTVLPMPLNGNHTDPITFFTGHEGSVLDIGCGHGVFLEYAKKKGWEVYGIDFDRKVIEDTKEKIGHDRAEVADVIEYANTTDRRFDLITFFDVLEHVDNHDAFMAAVRTLLKPGGHIAMSMPYRHGWRWLMPADLPPRHLTRWDRSSLTTFLKRQGFTVRRSTRHSEGVGFLMMKLRNRYGTYFSFNLVSRTAKKIPPREVAVTSTTSQKPSPKVLPVKVRVVYILARTKDWLIFGIPAVILYLALLPFRSRYVTLRAIAQLRATK